MHDPSKSGNEFFLCDFCRRHWDPDRPMVEGHQGSLICGSCLTLAYACVINLNQGQTPGPGVRCVMCLEERPEPFWTSPLHPEARVCARCIRQAAGALSRDPDSGWSRPA
jgi:hypothetical protein